MSCSELAAGFEWLQVGGMQQEDVHALMRAIDSTGDGLLSVDEWREAFPKIADSDPSTQSSLGSSGLGLSSRTSSPLTIAPTGLMRS